MVVHRLRASPFHLGCLIRTWKLDVSATRTSIIHLRCCSRSKLTEQRRFDMVVQVRRYPLPPCCVWCHVRPCNQVLEFFECFSWTTWREKRTSIQRSHLMYEICQDLTSITQSELMRQVNDNSKNGVCTLYRPATYTTIHVVASLCTWGMIS